MHTRYRLAALALALLAGAPSVAAQSAIADALDAVRTHFRNRAASFTATPADLADLAVTDAYASRGSGATYVYLRQRVNGLEVFNATANAAVAADGRVAVANGAFVYDLARKAGSAVTPALTAEAALSAAASRLGVTGAILTNEPGGEPRAPRLGYFATEAGAVRLAWDLTVYQPARVVGDGVHEEPHWWNARVDATTGEVLDRVDWITHCSFPHAAGDARASVDLRAETAMPFISGSYNVFAIPLESPSHGPRSLVVTPHNPTASPNGWHRAGSVSYTITQGNNVHAYADADATPNVPDPGGSPDGGGSLVFDFPFDPAVQPEANLPAAVTNLFYWNNIVHDVLWHYGFDEVGGNFQAVNAGGGLGSDYVQAEAIDASGVDNANFSTPPDGQRPRMQMYRWSPAAILEATAPATIAGPYAAGTSATFGAQVFDYTQQVVPVTDGSPDYPSRGCGPILNAAQVAGKIALIQRGPNSFTTDPTVGCPFTLKVKNAQNAGAIGAIIYNCAFDECPPGAANPGDVVIGMSGADPTITIGAMFVANNSGITLLSGLPATTVHMERGTIFRDSDFDAGVIAHEYGHGISNRLTGGPSTTSCLGNAEQMGEGWSDYFGLMLTQRNGDTAAQPRGVGTYLGFEPNNGPGIRNAPYSTNFAVNPFTYQDVITGGGTVLSVPHGIGFAWATMVWEMTWELIAAHGYDPDVYNASGTAGNQIALRLVTEGLKLQPCSPGFVDGRNAILQADQLIYGGANRDRIWAAFARRGLGANASQGSSASVNDGVADFTTPPVANEDGATASAFTLSPAVPNPANGQARFSLQVTELQPVRVEVYDALGRRVALLHDGPLTPGVGHAFEVDATRLAAGVYVYRATGESFTASGRVTIVH